MIKIFSNQTTVPKITVQSRFLKNKTTFLEPNEENGLVEKVKSDTLLFVKIAVNGLLTGESIGKLQLALAYVETSMSYNFKVIKCPQTTWTDTYMKSFANSLTGNEVVEETQVIYGTTQSKKVTEQKEIKFVNLDLTNIAKKSLGNNPIFMFVIKNNSENESLHLLDPQFVASQVACCNATMSDFNGLNGMYKFDKHSVGGIGTGCINLYNQKLIHVIDGLTSLSKKMPITYSTIYNYGKSNEKSFLAKELTPSFQYKVFKSGDEYVIEDPTGIRNYYQEIDRTSDKGKNIISTYGIKHTENTGKLYFSDIDNSYFYLNVTESKETIKLYDKKQNETLFEVLLNESTIALGRFTKIMSRETKFGDKLTYQWSGAKLEKISNSDGEEVLFSYDTSNRIIKIDFKNLNQYIEYTYQLNEWKINITTYSYKLSSKTEPELTKLKEAQLNYIEVGDTLPRNLYLNNIIDKITGDSIHYTMNNNAVVSSVSMKNKQNEIGYKVNYSSKSYCTTATSFDGTKHYYYFDNYGRCKLEMDDKGRSITYNYDEFENGESKHLTSVSNVQTNSRNLLENHSFEDSDNLFKSDSLGWKKTGGTNSKVETKIGGVYGEKYLFIDKVANETITISQDIVSPTTNQVTLKGFIKHQAKNANESLATGNIKVKVSGTYTRDESVIVTVDSTTTKTQIRPVSHYHNKEVTFSENSDWKPFSLTSTLPSDAYNITMKVELIVSGISCEVGIDDLQLCTGKQKIRYNLIENGYMEFVENGLPKGWLFENKEDEDTLIEVTSNDEHASVLGNKVMCFKEGDVTQTISTVLFKTKKMYKKIPCHGLSGEQLVFSVFAKALASSGNIFRSYMKIYHTNGQYRNYTFDFDKNFKNWQMLTRAVTAEYDFNQVEIGVEYSGGNEALFDAFQLYKDSYGKYYNYDERGNIREVVSDDGNSTRIDYDDDNQITEIFATDGSSFKYNYDAKGRLERVIDLAGNTVSIEYNAQDYVVKTTITTPNGETIVNSQERDKWGEITNSTDEHGNQTSVGLNYLNQVTQITHSNGLVESFHYNKDFSLKSFEATVNNLTHKNSFTYDDSRRIKVVESENGTKYNLVYDSFGRLTEINVNGEVINQFSYDEITNGVNKGLVSRKQYGANGDYFDFIYNKEDQIEQVKLNGTPIVEYDYNEDGQVCEVKDIRNNTSKYFTYDLKGRLMKVVDNQNRAISYTYDNLDHMQKTSYQIGDTEKSFDFEYEYETNEYTKEGYFNRIEKVFGDEIVKGGIGAKGTYGATPVLKTINQVYDNDLKMKVYSFEDNYDFIWYNLDNFNINRTNGYSNGKYFNLNDWKKRFFYNKAFYMWIKPSGTLAEEKLFTFQYIVNTDGNFRKNVSELIICSDGKIGYSSLLTNTVVKKTTNTLKLDEWNLVGVKIYKEENSTTSKAMVFLNDECTLTFDISEDVTQITNLLVANQNTSNVDSTTNGYNKVKAELSLPFQICMMSFGAYKYTVLDMKAIYKEGLKYLVNPTPIQKATGVSYYNADVYQDFDVITLNGSLESTRGNKPIALMQTDPSFKVEKARIFKYDPTIQRHVYGAFDDVSNFTHGNKSLLAYNLGLKNKGVISFRFKVDEKQENVRYILVNYKDGRLKSSIIISRLNESNTDYLHLVVGENVFSTNEPMIYNHWYQVVLFFKENGVCLYVDGKQLLNENITFNLTDCTTYIGSAKDGTFSLNGYMDMLAYTNKEVDNSNYQTLAKNLFDNGKPISIRKHLDSLGRVTQKLIQTNKTEYKTTYIQDKLRIHREIEPGNYNYVYTYDNMGNIVQKQYKIKDIDIHSTSYQYDKLGRLIEEVHPNGDIETFTYDENGNIFTHQIKTEEGTLTTNEKYNYSSTIKDQLVSIQNVTTGSIMKEYFYIRDITGNITKIIDEDGRCVVQYNYDAWGNFKKTIHIDCYASHSNPFVYKGYFFDEETNWYYLKSRYYDPSIRRFISADNFSYLDNNSLTGLNLYSYCGNSPILGYDPEGTWNWKKFLKGTAIVITTALFVAAIVASAGTVGALVGVGAAAIGMASSTVATVVTVATITTYVVAGGVAIFGVSDLVEVITDDFNPIRDVLMGGNQKAYDITHTVFDTLGSLAVLAGTFGPKILQSVAKSGGTPKISNGKTVGYQRNFYDKNGKWNFRIDATTHGNPKLHHDPHIHYFERDTKQGGFSKAVKYFWEIIKEWFSQ